MTEKDPGGTEEGTRLIGKGSRWPFLRFVEHPNLDKKETLQENRLEGTVWGRRKVGVRAGESEGALFQVLISFPGGKNLS